MKIRYVDMSIFYEEIVMRKKEQLEEPTDGEWFA